MRGLLKLNYDLYLLLSEKELYDLAKLAKELLAGTIIEKNILGKFQFPISNEVVRIELIADEEVAHLEGGTDVTAD